MAKRLGYISFNNEGCKVFGCTSKPERCLWFAQYASDAKYPSSKELEGHDAEVIQNFLHAGCTELNRFIKPRRIEG